MNGVEILASNEMVTQTLFNWNVFGIALGIIILLFAIVGFALSICHQELYIVPVCVLIGVILGTIFGVLFGEIQSTPTEYKMQYKVTISNEVAMNEFFEKYELIDQEGKIYTVRER